MTYRRKFPFAGKTSVLFWLTITFDLDILNLWRGRAGVDYNSASGKRLEKSLKEQSQKSRLSMRCLMGKEINIAQAAVSELSGTVETVNSYT
jgi:hypothetical protein